VNRHLENARRKYHLSAATSCIIVAAPYLIVGLFFFFISYPPTQDLAALMTFPNYPIEWVTFIMCLVGGILSCRLAFRLKRQHETGLTWIFYLVFGLGLLWTAGETSAWGQQVLGYHTPHWMRVRNAQGQMTLHNMYGWQNHNHWLRTVFALGGFIGIALQNNPRYRKIAAPAILFSWFLVIAIKCGLDFWTKSFPSDSEWHWAMFQWMVNRTSKVVKMTIGIAGFLYVWLNGRMLAAELGRSE
jgi:cellobiose-specific phosphotransferase system component IIC